MEAWIALYARLYQVSPEPALGLHRQQISGRAFSVRVIGTVGRKRFLNTGPQEMASLHESALDAGVRSFGTFSSRSSPAELLN